MQGQGRFAAEHPEYKDGLIGSGSNGSKVYIADVQGDSVAIKKFEAPIPQDRLAKLKDMESHKSLVLIRGVVVSDDPLAKIHINTLIISLCHRQNLETVFASNMHIFSFSRKMKWAHSIALGLEWIHVVCKAEVPTTMLIISQRKPQILHSRLRPSNLLMTHDWKIRVSDYGQGYVPPKSEAEKFFIAPELLASGTETEKADVYSYGALLW